MTTYSAMLKLVKLATAKDDANNATELDAMCRSAINNSILWVERNYTAKYMEVTTSFTLKARTYPPAYRLPKNPKSFNWTRVVEKSTYDESRGYRDVARVDPRDLDSVGIGEPTAWWLDGVEFMVFNAIADSDVKIEVQYNGYTGNLEDTDKHWLFAFAPDVVIARSMQFLAPFLREPEVLGLYRTLLDDGMKTMILADEELRNTGQLVQMGAPA